MQNYILVLLKTVNDAIYFPSNLSVKEALRYKLVLNILW